MMKLKAKPFDNAVIQTYAHTSSYSEEEIEARYEELNKMLKQVKSTDVIMVIGDMNAKIGKGKVDDIVGPHGLGERNASGERFLCFLIEKNLVIANTLFEQPNRLLYTWKSPGDVTRNQIDFILVRKRFRNSIRWCKTYPGADIGSDHNPVVAKICVKLKRAAPRNQKKREFIDWGKLKIPEEKEKY